MLKRIVLEAHRRSLWQVLTIYAIGSWVALQVVGEVTEAAGLPDWVPGFALVLLIIGLPVVLATAFVQEGGSPVRPGTTEPLDARPSTHHRLFTWKNAVLGGVAAFSILGVVVGGYFLMRATGIGPWASLEAQGLLEAREPVMLAEFDNSTADSTLGQIVTEALRVDLLESDQVSVLPSQFVADAVQRTGRSPDARLTAELAREIAIRDGIKAVIEGEVGAVGTGYVLTASVTDPHTGGPLAAFRETAAADSELLDAIDRLSRRIREKAGESLRSINASEPLSAVTTSSLDALRAYTSSLAAAVAGQRGESIRLLKRAVEIDPQFAMAHRRLAAELRNAQLEPELMRASAARAYELRGNLTRPEALMAEAVYHTLVEPDPGRAGDAYRQLLAIRPDDPVALNNLALQLVYSRAEVEEGIDLLTRASQVPGARTSAYNNLVLYFWDVRQDTRLPAVIDEAVRRYPDNYFAHRLHVLRLAGERRFAAAHAAADSLRRTHATAPLHELDSQLVLASMDMGRGRMREARQHLRAADGIVADHGLDERRGAIVVRLALGELLVARDPGSAAASLRDFMDNHAWRRASQVELASAASTAALAGDARLAATFREALETATPAHLRTREDRSNLDVVDWALALARNDGVAALAAAESNQRNLHGDCAGRRCYGWFELATAYEQLGLTADAIRAWERYVEGLPFGSAQEEGVFTPEALERLAELHDRQGNREQAIRFYSQFAELWQEADPELQPRVRRARDRAAALLAATG